MSRKIRAFVKKGGRILWIGCSRPTVLGALTQAVKEDDDNPVFENENFNKGVVKIPRSFYGSLDEKEKKETGFKKYFFKNPPFFDAKLYIPKCAYNITISEFIKPIVTVETKAGNIISGAMLVDETGKAVHVILPMYVLYPYILRNRTDALYPLGFDASAKKLFLAAIMDLL